MPHNYSHTSDNPVVMERLNAMPEDGWVYGYNTDKSYTGFYHLMQDGTAMIGEGVLGVSHTINSNEIILQTYTDDDKDPVSGCTDPAATNYDELATVDDNSCEYASSGGDESMPTMPPPGMSAMNPQIGYLSPLGQWIWTGSGWVSNIKDIEEEDTVPQNPVVEVGLNATLQDGWYFADPQMEYLLPDLNNPYEGLYHLMQDGTYMIGEGVLNASHEINPNEIIIQYTTASVEVEGEMPVADYETIQEVREIVSDLFYKLWFESNTLTDEQVLSLQTTIRDGKKQTGRAESEPLVFYKKDRNTLENREDLQGEEFENICQDIFDNELPNDIIPDKFEIYEPPEESTNSPEEFIEVNTYWNLKRYIMQYTNYPTSYDIVIAEELIKYHDDLLPPDSDDTDTQESF